MPRSIHGPWPLRALKWATAIVLGAPASLLWSPFMLPFALMGPFVLVRDALAGRSSLMDVHVFAVAMAGTAGLAGYWLWVFDHPRRSIGMQRITGLLWLAGAGLLAFYPTVMQNQPQALIVAVIVLAVVVVCMGLDMFLRPRPPAIADAASHPLGPPGAAKAG